MNKVTPVSLGYPRSVFNKNSTLNATLSWLDMPMSLMDHSHCSFADLRSSCAGCQDSFVHVQRSCVDVQDSFVNVQFSCVDVQDSCVHVQRSCVDVQRSFVHVHIVACVGCQSFDGVSPSCGI